ncbi:MAG: hypothetical protein JST21_17160 [Bacteroidetes bacterium]|nr:hypothetical protein [Bacteroidota bacterium]
MKQRFLIFFILVFTTGKVFSQNHDTDTSANLNTVDGIIQTLYGVISGPAGQERNWETFKNLFSTDARMYIAVPGKNNSSTLTSITPDDYIERNKTRLSDIGFNESELYRIVNTYGAGTQVFSTYETHFTNRNGEEEITKGINNIQLFFNGDRYYIVSIFWDGNAKNIDVPDRYLPENKNTEYQINL